MTPAELKTQREALGLTLEWLAQQAGVQRRTAQYWETGRPGRDNIPEDVAEILSQLESQAKLMTEQAVDQVKAIAEQEGRPPQCVDLVRYRTNEELWSAHNEMQGLPATYHAAVLYRTKLSLEEIGVKANFIYSSP